MDISIAPLVEADFEDWLDMALELWPEHSREEMSGILRALMRSEREDAFICRAVDGSPVGFVNLSVRSDWVEGSTTSPVGYVEGIYVKEPYRMLHVGRRLIEVAERWTADRGMSELGSDAELDNVRSHAFHESVGFTEANRTVGFIKRLRPQG